MCEISGDAGRRVTARAILVKVNEYITPLLHEAHFFTMRFMLAAFVLAGAAAAKDIAVDWRAGITIPAITVYTPESRNTKVDVRKQVRCFHHIHILKLMKAVRLHCICCKVGVIENIREGVG